MAGPHDQITEQGQSPDPARPREPGRPGAGLRQRMEQLPPGHPSSPYHNDGSRKPPPPDPTDYELPIPGDPGYHAEPMAEADSDHPLSSASDQQLFADDTAHKGSEGSWEWKSCRLTPEQRQAADRAFEGWVAAEGRDQNGNYGDHGLTPAMRRIEAELDHCHLVDETEKYALKTPDRFKEKLSKDIARNPDKAVTELAHEIHDAVRYTFILEVGEDFETYWSAQGKLEEKGYELEVRRNTWANPEYKGINTRWRDPVSHLPFEVQFHTEASWVAKQETHLAYEKISDSRTRPSERELLRMYQKEVSARVHVPERVSEIPDYRKEGDRFAR
jgi:hypothetical protein